MIYEQLKYSRYFEYNSLLVLVFQKNTCFNKITLNAAFKIILSEVIHFEWRMVM